MFRVHHSVLCRLFLPVIHRIAWNMDSPNFIHLVANGSSTYRQAPAYGLCYPPFVVKTLRLWHHSLHRCVSRGCD